MPANMATPATALLPESFVEEVRATLDHLYDYMFLHNHPLTWRLCSEGGADGVTRAQRMRTLLLDSIERLRPAQRPLSEPGTTNDEMRAYAILTYRCIDSMSMDEIAGKLGLSRRQAYREYAKAVEAVAGLVWDALPAEPVAPPAEPAAIVADPTRLSAAAEEVARLTSKLLLEPVDLAAVAQEVVDLLAPRVQHTGVALRVQRSEVALPIVADRVLLRQALLNLFSYALDQAQRGREISVTCGLQAHGGSHGYAMALRLATCRGDDQPATKREGVGVTVAQKLIEAMGGEAAVCWQSGAEWCCSLLLPVCPAGYGAGSRRQCRLDGALSTLCCGP